MVGLSNSVRSRASREKPRAARRGSRRERHWCGAVSRHPLALLTVLVAWQAGRLPAVAARRASRRHDEALQQGAALHTAGDVAGAAAVYARVLKASPRNADALHLSGLAAYEGGGFAEAARLIEKALEADPANPSYLMNLGQVLRTGGDPAQAAAVLRRATALAPANPLAWSNRALAEHELGDLEAEAAAHERVVGLVPLDGAANEALAKRRWDAADFAGALAVYERALARAPPGAVPPGAFELGHGVALHRLGRLDAAYALYERATAAGGGVAQTGTVNMAAILQEQGRMEEAIAMYAAVVVADPTAAQAYNNMGAALMTMGDIAAAVEALEHAVRLNPQGADAYVNLGSIYTEEGDLELGREKYATAHALGGNDGLLVRRALSLPPIPSSAAHLAASRQDFRDRLTALVAAGDVRIANPVGAVERVHFYLPYAGADDDRELQSLAATLFLSACPVLGEVAMPPPPPPPPPPDASAAAPGRRPARIGFVSKFFGPYEPHGMLLRGILAGLPRTHFRVVLLPIPSPGKGPGTGLDKGVEAAVDEVVPLSLNYWGNRHTLEGAGLDVLVYADMLSEPMSYFLGFARFAPVQCVFWGNPITTGKPSIDYFLTADRMERQDRTSQAADDYSEAAVLLDGQGIWYDAPEVFDLPATERRDRASYGLPPGEWTLLLCAQSLFKLHPDFDAVVARVLEACVPAVPGGPERCRVVFTEGRRARWTADFQKRLRGAMRPELWALVSFVPRQSAHTFAALVSLADAMLHPFPFGGSRTSADGIQRGVPVVTKPTNKLRGRMAGSLFATMGAASTVAANVSNYVAIAHRLALDADFRAATVAEVRATRHLIWEDREVVYEWARFLSRALGRPAPPPEAVGYRPKPAPAPLLGGGSKGLGPAWTRGEMQRPLGEKSMGSYTAAVYTPAQQDCLGVDESGAPRPPGSRCGGGAGGEAAAAGRPATLSALLAAARAAHDAGRLPEALEAQQTALMMAPRDAGIVNDCGATLQQLWRLPEAAAMFERAIALRPHGYPTALNNLGVTHAELGNHDRAEAAFVAALALETGGGGGGGGGGADAGTALYNLGNLFRDRRDYLGAVTVMSGHLAIPRADSDAGLAVLLLALAEPFAFASLGGPDVAWPADAADATLADAAARVRRDHLAAANSLAVFVGWLDGAGAAGRTALDARPFYARLTGIGPAPAPSAAAAAATRVHLVVQYYEPTAADRRAELAYCLAANAANPHVAEIHVLAEEPLDLAWLGPAGLAKVTLVVVGRRLTFRGAFEYAARALDGEVVAVANADVFFDGSLARLGDTATLPLGGRVLALLRREWQCALAAVPAADAAANTAPLSACGQLRPRVDSQDAWVFRAPLGAPVAAAADFAFGRPRCDQRLARIFRDAGLVVTNPGLALALNHVDARRGAADAGSGSLGYGGQGQVAGAIDSVLLDTQWLF